MRKAGAVTWLDFPPMEALIRGEGVQDARLFSQPRSRVVPPQELETLTSPAHAASLFRWLTGNSEVKYLHLLVKHIANPTPHVTSVAKPTVTYRIRH